MNTEEWKMISNEAKLLISKMLEKDPLKVIYYIINKSDIQLSKF